MREHSRNSIWKNIRSPTQVLTNSGILTALDAGVSADPTAQVQALLTADVPKEMHTAIERLAKLSKKLGSEPTSALWTKIAR